MSDRQASSRRTAEMAMDFLGPILRKSAYVSLLAVLVWVVLVSTGALGAIGWTAAGLGGVVVAMLTFFVASAVQVNLILPREVRELSRLIDRHDLGMKFVELQGLICSDGADGEGRRRAIETKIDQIEVAAQEAIAEGADPNQIEAYLALELERSDISLDRDRDLIAPLLDLLERLRSTQPS